jgi:tRNA nucleotidyltransferase (CCA-adding enzyme)
MNDLLSRCTAFLLEHRYDAYLVGGSVRDQELGRESHDIDLATPSSALQMARMLANQFGGAYYPLDAERETGRVVMPDRAVVDVALLRGADILSDLAARDFTINAMARRLAQPEILIDPHHGLRDLRQRRLRAVSELIFAQDPARLLRAVRLATELGLAIEPETYQLIERDAALIEGLAGERAREEVLRIFQSRDAATSLRTLADLRLLGPMVPYAVPDEAHLGVIERLSSLDGDATLLSHSAVALVAEFAPLLGDDMSADLDTGHTNAVIVKLAALYDRAEDITTDLGALRFRRDQIQYAHELVAGRGGVRELSSPVSPLAAHRFFRNSGAGAGHMGLIVSALAEAYPLTEADPLLEIVRELLIYYRDSYEQVIAPRPLLNGRELAQRFGLRGRQIGDGLKALLEAQVAGTIQSVADAERHFGAQSNS